MAIKAMFETKYVLSTGVIKHGSYEIGGDGYARKKDAEWYFVSLKVGRDIHNTKDEAIAAACAARDRKISSLRKQLAKLEAMQFSVESEV